MKKQAGFATTIAAAAILAVCSIGPASAGPLPVNGMAVKAAAPADVVDVRYYRRRYRGGAPIAAGIAFGLISAAIASQYYYDGPYYYYAPYPPPYYYYPYGYYRPYYRPYWGPRIRYRAYRAYPAYRYHGPRHYRVRHRAHR